jgi:hypothetical protein
LSAFFEVVPHLVQLDDHGAALRLGLLRVDLGEPLDPGLHVGVDTPSSLAVRFIETPLR